MSRDDRSDTRNTVVAALGLWAGAVALGVGAGVFGRLPGEVLVALAVFATGFAIAVVVWDVRVRGWLDGQRARTGRIALLGTATLLATAIAGHSGTSIPDIGSAPWAPMLLFGAPLVATLWVSAAVAAAADAIRRPASTAPARRPAAT